MLLDHFDGPGVAKAPRCSGLDHEHQLGPVDLAVEFVFRLVVAPTGIEHRLDEAPVASPPTVELKSVGEDIEAMAKEDFGKRARVSEKCSDFKTCIARKALGVNREPRFALRLKNVEVVEIAV